MTDLVLVGAQRRITMMVKIPGNRVPQPITFWPSTKDRPNRVNRIARDIWRSLLKKRGSPRLDQAQQSSPLTEYLATGLLWEMTSAKANLVSEGKDQNISPHGINGGAHRPQPREPKSVEGLEHVQEINEATAEQVTLQVSEE